MANSYSVVPNILPGNVTVGGDLTVLGQTLRLGPAAGFARLQSRPTEATWSFNFEEIGITRDDAAQGMAAIHLSAVPLGPFWERGNAAANIRFEGARTVLFTDYVNHNHTGTITADTVYDATIRPSFIGPNGGLRIRFGVQHAVQGGAATIVIISFGGVTAGSYTIAAAAIVKGELTIHNRNSAGSQICQMEARITGQPVAVTENILTVDSTAVQHVILTVQNGAVGDQQAWRYFHVEHENTFGPVTT